jgi:hypothetical protein
MSDTSRLRGAVAKPVRTEYGVRTELRLLATSIDGARYEARWFLGDRGAHADAEAAAPTSTPDAHGLATVDAAGEVNIEISAGRLPAWAVAFTEKLLRTTARGVEAGRYPRRLTRWREGPAS